MLEFKEYDSESWNVELWYNGKPIVLRGDQDRDGQPILSRKMFLDYPNAEKCDVLMDIVENRLDQILPSAK